MFNHLVRRWWTLVLRGIFAIAFGVIAFTLPGTALAALVLLFGIYALLDGIFAFYSVIVGRVSGQKGWMIASGIASIIVGVLTLAWPAITAVVLLYFIAAWAIATGIMQIMAAIDLRGVIQNEWLLIITGILSVVFGVLIAANPSAGALGIIWLIGLYAVILGALLISLGVRLKVWARKHPIEVPGEVAREKGVPTEAGRTR